MILFAAVSGGPLYLHRVEGRGKATITDVVYTSKTSSEDEKPPTESKDRLKVLHSLCIQFCLILV